MFGNVFATTTTQGVLGSVDRHHVVHAPKGMLRIKYHVETDPCYVPSDEAAFEPHSNVVEHFALVINHGSTEQLIAECVGSCMHVVRICRSHDDAEIVQR